MATPLPIAKSRLGNATKHGTPDEVLDARRDFKEAKIAAYVQRVLAEAPPLTDDQRARLAALFGTAPASEHTP